MSLKTKLLLKLSDKRLLAIMLLGVLLAVNGGLQIKPLGDEVDDVNVV